MVLPQTTRSVKAHAQSTKWTVLCSRLVCSHVSKVVLFISKVIKADTVLCLIDLDPHASVFFFKGPEKWDDRTFLHDHLFILPEMGHELPNYLCCWSFWSCTQYFGITEVTEALAALTGLFHSLTCHSFTILSKVLLFFYFLWADAWINALKAFNSLARHWIQTIERQPENKNLKTIKQFPARD